MGSHLPVLSIYLLVAQATIHGIHAAEYEVINNAKETPGGHRFESEITEQYVKQQMLSATLFIHKTFDQREPFSTKHVAKISLNILGGHSYDFVVSENSHEIKVSAECIEGYKDDDEEGEEYLQKHFTRRLYHAMTNIWQWTANGQIPPTLKEGIADYVVLKSGKAPGSWKEGEGKTWDESSSVTAMFLAYCERHHERQHESLSQSFVAKLNAKLRTDYSEHYFQEILGMPLADMWQKYKSQYI